MRAYHSSIILDSWKSMIVLIFHIQIVLLHYINSIIGNITFFNHLCLHCNDHDGSFRAHIEFMHISNLQEYSSWCSIKWVLVHQIVVYLLPFQTYSTKINTFKSFRFPNIHYQKSSIFFIKKIKKFPRQKSF
jgi:K+-transporting ATPase A subunit